MHVAIAEVADGERSRARAEARHGRIGAGDEGGDGGDRHGDVVLDIAAFALLRRGEGFAQAPEGLRLRQRARKGGVADHAGRGAGLKRGEQQTLGRAVRLAGQVSMSTYQGWAPGKGSLVPGTCRSTNATAMRGMNSTGVMALPPPAAADR